MKEFLFCLLLFVLLVVFWGYFLAWRESGAEDKPEPNTRRNVSGRHEPFEACLAFNGASYEPLWRDDAHRSEL